MSAQAETVTATTPVADIPKDEGFRVYLGNLSFKTTEDEIREFAGKVGEILTVVIPKRAKRPSGFAFVHYKTEHAANTAVQELNEAELDGRKVTIEGARSREEQASRRDEILEKRKVAREAKTADATEKKATQVNEAGESGETKTKKKAKKTTRRRQPGQEDDDDEEEEEAAGAATDSAGPDSGDKKKARKPRKSKTAKAAESSRIDGGEASTEEKKPKEKKPREPRLQLTGEQSPNTIFVANLPYDLDDDALAGIFTDLSIKVKSAKIVIGLRRGRGGRTFRASRGFGFVEIENPSEQKEAVEKVDGSLIGERKITAKIANEMKPIEEVEAAAASD